jgi:hypothetical protein
MKLVPVKLLTPAAYNPRVVDPERLAMVRLSLRKLGWLLPVFATEEGEILSGHQRTHEAAALGYTQVPVRPLPPMATGKLKALNILFNRSTNDMDIDAVPAELKARISAEDVRKLAAALPDHPISSFPCMHANRVEIGPLVKANAGRWIPYAYTVAKSLAAQGITMPLIVGPDDVVINGIGRLQMLAERKEETAEAIYLRAEQAEFARLMLNFLSMDFDLKAKYADLLRYGSFRRLRRQRTELGRGFVFAITGNRAARHFDITDAASRERWIAEHGRNVLDFGAGHLTETNLLRAVGVECTPFEPYRVNPDREEIDKAESLRVVREFLAAVESKREFSSIFISSVLNSVPFEEDRRAIVTILRACAGRRTKVYAVASSDQQRGLKNMGKKFLNQRSEQYGFMLAGYEPNVIVGELATKPKAQKYHTPDEFHALFRTGFGRVSVKYDGEGGANISAIACDPMPFRSKADFAQLAAALAFEFDLPYPDGSRMGMAEEAKAAFGERLGQIIA